MILLQCKVANGVVATEDSSFILAQDEAEASVIEPEETEPEPAAEESPKKNSEGGDGGDDPNSTASSDLSLSVSKQTEPREDPEVIKLWKENQVKMLQEKDENEEKAQEELKKQAKAELEDWYKQHSEQLGKLQAANRAASISYEQELETTTEKLTPGTEWERVAKLCDFNPKSARNTKDIGRMRSVILQLKQEGSSPTVPQGV